MKTEIIYNIFMDIDRFNSRHHISPELIYPNGLCREYPRPLDSTGTKYLLGTRRFKKETDAVLYRLKHAGVVSMEKANT